MQNYYSLIVLIVLFGLMYFLMLRPQRKQQQKHQQTLSQLKKGDHVITIGRLHGVVDEINREDGTVTLDCDGIYLVFDLRAVAQVTQQTPAVAAPTSETTPESTATATSSAADATTESAASATETPDSQA